MVHQRGSGGGGQGVAVVHQRGSGGGGQGWWGQGVGVVGVKGW